MASRDLPNVSFAAVVPAAGRAERFGGGKLVVDVNGQTLLDRALDCLLSAGAAQVIVVAADPAELSPVVRLRHSHVRVVVNPVPARGMFSSIQVGLSAVGDVDQVLVLPGDMPFVRVDTVVRVAAEGSRLGQPVTPVFEGRRGHPVALPRLVLTALCSADAGGNLKDALRLAGASRAELPVDDPGILRDVDTREDLAPQTGSRP